MSEDTESNASSLTGIPAAAAYPGATASVPNGGGYAGTPTNTISQLDPTLLSGHQSILPAGQPLKTAGASHAVAKAAGMAEGQDEAEEEEDPRVYSPLRIPPPGMHMPSMEDMQLTEILEPNDNDVLCGRGGGTNNHLGNEKFRVLVNSQKVLYLHSSKRDKPFVSRGVVRAVRAQDPPGRFLQKDEGTGFYYDIGDVKAREKTSQALREGAPDIRNQMNSNDSSVHDAMVHAVSVNPFFIPTAKSSNGKRGRSSVKSILHAPPTVPPPPPRALFQKGSFTYPNRTRSSGAGGPTPNPKQRMPFGSPGLGPAMHGQMLMETGMGSPYSRFGPEGGPMPSMPGHGLGLGMRGLPPGGYPYPSDVPPGDLYHTQKPNARMHRLDFAEVVAQCTTVGAAPLELDDMDRRVSLYLDAGILGIPPDEIVTRLAKGETEFDIIEQKYLELKAGKEATVPPKNSKRKKVEETFVKKGKASAKQNLLTQQEITDALVMVRGA